jgi:hypothetical protein
MSSRTNYYENQKNKFVRFQDVLLFLLNESQLTPKHHSIYAHYRCTVLIIENIKC